MSRKTPNEHAESALAYYRYGQYSRSFFVVFGHELKALYLLKDDPGPDELARSKVWKDPSGQSDTRVTVDSEWTWDREREGFHASEGSKYGSDDVLRMLIKDLRVIIDVGENNDFKFKFGIACQLDTEGR